VVEAGDLDGLVSLLTEDVTHYVDGGGKVHAAMRPIIGPDHVARYFLGLRRFIPPDAYAEVSNVNSRPAIVMRFANGKAFSVITFTLRDGLIKDIHSVLNPDKLTHI
jgi:RNA polymerase sigma-70 factor, ECF subfamily